MDIAIPFSGFSNWHGLELKYALRSIEKYYPFNTVYLIGQKPTWIKNVVHIPAMDSLKCRGANVFNKLCLCPSPEFVGWFDDHYLLKPVAEIEPHYIGTLPEIIEKKQGLYKNILRNTFNLLTEMGKPTLCYDSHTPTIFKKEQLLELKSFQWGGSISYAAKSLYYNIFGPEGSLLPTAKLELPWTESEIIEKDLTWLSSPDILPRGLQSFLLNHFPDKSNFEL